MKQTLRFFRIDEDANRFWYADVPNHTLAENQMVAGADTFLETADNMLGGRGEVNVTFADAVETTDKPFIVKLQMTAHNQWGATYAVTGPLAQANDAEGFKVWICNVTHDVMGEHPKAIYIFDIC